MPAGTLKTYPSRLRCGRCGLVYSRAAVAREITLATGIDCRRCGGGLHQTDEAPAERTDITAVRAPVSGSGRRPFE
jgi:ribosomal protein S27AE